MRLVTKSTLSALVAFLVLLGIFAFWSEYQLRSLTSALMQGTARLLGSEIAAVISQTAAEDLLRADPDAQARLEALVADLSSNSEVVASVTVVDAYGFVVASKDMETGRQLARPDVIFGNTKRSQFLTLDAPFEGGTYHLFVPLLKNDALLGYLRLSLSNDRLMALYRRARRQLALLALVGLACVAALGLALEVQFSRMGRTLTQAFDAARRGAELPQSSRREFSEAFDAARRAGEELNVARSQTADAQRRFGELMKVMDVGVVLVGPDYSLDFANEPARHLFECIDAGELEHRWDEIRSRLQASSAAIAADGGAVDLDVGHNGQGAPLRLEFYPREDRAGWLILVKNREMLDALENELRLAIQMRGFAQFYMAFAHDLKAPLNAMVLNLELLKRTLADPARVTADEKTRSRQDGYIQTLVGEVSRLDRYLRTILTHAAPPRTDEGRKQFDLRELLEELGSLLDPQARHHRINLRIEVPPMPVNVTGHRDRLKQALLNIAINGLESMPDGGEMSLQAAAADGVVTISIRDSGPGMPPEVIREIYKMHFTTKDGGTGIGLHVARSVIQAHSGDIQVESEVGRGTCFRVTLPANVPGAAAEDAASENFLHKV
jgi:signal transduction histidine kinase